MSMPDSTKATYREAVRAALRDSMLSDDRVLLVGEDVASAGGVFKVSDGLLEEFGPERVMDTPISEMAIVGAGIGLALAGYRPVVELMFADFAACAWDQIVNQAAKYLYLSAGQMPVPLVIRTAGGGGGRFAAQHSQTTESWYLSVPGLKVVVPATAQDAYSLLRKAIEDPGPVVFIEHKNLYSMETSLDREATVPGIGKARIARAGRDITIVASLAMLHRALEAAEHLSRDGIEAEVIDIRSLSPLDFEAIIDSVRQTGRLLTVEEQQTHGGWGSLVVAEVLEATLDSMDAGPRRLGLPNGPLAFSPRVEDAAIPSADRIADEAARMLGRNQG